jgi:hypothetical protein
MRIFTYSYDHPDMLPEDALEAAEEVNKTADAVIQVQSLTTGHVTFSIQVPDNYDLKTIFGLGMFLGSMLTNTILMRQMESTLLPSDN